jgi:hypothetical protein
MTTWTTEAGRRARGALRATTFAATLGAVLPASAQPAHRDGA